MSYLEAVQDKRVVNKSDLDHKELIEAVNALKAYLIVKTGGRDSQLIAEALASKLTPIFKLIENALTQQKPADHSDLLQAIKSIDMSPVINLPEPAVTVNERPIDLSPLETAIRESKPELTIPLDAYDLSRYKAQDLKDDGDIQYIGFLNPEGNWYIIENDASANKMRYLFGDKAYTKHFKSAGSYKYKLLDKAIHAKA